MRVVTLYTRAGCHLCDEARRVIEGVRKELFFSLIEVDIETDDRLHRAYLERIPVVELDGRELFEYFVDEAGLRDALTAEPVKKSHAAGGGYPLESGR